MASTVPLWWIWRTGSDLPIFNRSRNHSKRTAIRTAPWENKNVNSRLMILINRNWHGGSGFDVTRVKCCSSAFWWFCWVLSISIIDDGKKLMSWEHWFPVNSIFMPQDIQLALINLHVSVISFSSLFVSSLVIRGKMTEKLPMYLWENKTICYKSISNN